jgi:hypothetical protein
VNIATSQRKRKNLFSKHAKIDHPIVLGASRSFRRLNLPANSNRLG